MLKTINFLMRFSISELNRDLLSKKVFCHNKLMLRYHNTIIEIFIQVLIIYALLNCPILDYPNCPGIAQSCVYNNWTILGIINNHMVL